MLFTKNKKWKIISNSHKLIIFNHLYRLTESVDIVTVDESMIDYQPSSEKKKKSENNGDPIPVVFIKRKPHPNGLLTYILASYVDHPCKKGI